MIGEYAVRDIMRRADVRKYEGGRARGTDVPVGHGEICSTVEESAVAQARRPGMSSSIIAFTARRVVHSK
jgi:hypothetical protein